MGLIIERLRALGTSTIYRMSKQLQKIIGWSPSWLLLAKARKIKEETRKRRKFEEPDCCP